MTLYGNTQIAAAAVPQQTQQAPFGGYWPTQANTLNVGQAPAYQQQAQGTQANTINVAGGYSQPNPYAQSSYTPQPGPYSATNPPRMIASAYVPPQQTYQPQYSYGGNNGYYDTGYGNGQYAMNGNGQYTPFISTGQSLDQQDQSLVHQIEINANKVKLQQEANAMPNDSPLKNELDLQAQWGYNPTLSTGQAFNAWGGPTDIIDPKSIYNTISQDAQLAKTQLDPRLAARLQQVQMNANNAPLNNYGLTTGGFGGGTSFGAGDGGAVGPSQAEVDADWQRQVKQGQADNLFGGHVDLNSLNVGGGGFTNNPSTASAFGNYRGPASGGSVNNTGVGYQPGVTDVTNSAARIVPMGEGGDAPAASADPFRFYDFGSQSAPSLSQGTPAQMQQLQQLSQIAQGGLQTVDPMVGQTFNATNGMTLIANPNNDVFSDPVAPTRGNYSQIDNSGITQGLVEGGLLGNGTAAANRELNYADTFKGDNNNLLAQLVKAYSKYK